MARIDVVPDVHGRADKLGAALGALGWRRTAAGWRGPEPDAGLLFLGDLIDRGPDAKAVIGTVRALIDAGRATAVLGNHEFNAVHYHRTHPETGAPLRARTEKNTAQHAAFLAEFPLGAPETREVIDWMTGLPLFAEAGGLRAVHAAWTGAEMARLRAEAPGGVLDAAQWVRAADASDPLRDAAETLCKGPEAKLPAGVSFADKGGHVRTEVRLRWWRAGAATWREAAMSVPEDAGFLNDPLPDGVAELSYPADAPPVAFGHYWLTGTPERQAPNALCLDYSAGKEGPLVTYRWETGDAAFDLARITVHPLP